MLLKNKVAIICLVSCIVSILFVGSLGPNSNYSSSEGEKLSESNVKMVSSYPTNNTSFSSIAAHEKLFITNVEANCTSDSFLVNIVNNGSTPTTITEVSVNYTPVNSEDKLVILPNTNALLLLNLNEELLFLRTYYIKIQTLEGFSLETCYVIF